MSGINLSFTRHSHGILAQRRSQNAPRGRSVIPVRNVLAGAAGGSLQESRRVAVFVEPSPFSHISGMKIRFSNLITGLRDIGDDVLVVTPDKNPPKDFHGARVVNVLGIQLPFYKAPTLLLGFGLSVRVLWHLIASKPQIIHVASPGLLVFGAILYAKALKIPLLVSYHTHIPEYIPKYTWKGLVRPMWSVIRFFTNMADLTLVPSKAMKTELALNGCRGQRIDVWQRAVDTEMFHPRFRSVAMRAKITDGHPDDVVLMYVGRIGPEKNLGVLKGFLEQLPGARLVFVGDGPAREGLEKDLAGLPVHFTGMLSGEELYTAYASGDIFMMPSESETLGFVALEAMSSGVPVVAVAAGGLTDIITNPGVSGYLYQPGDYGKALELTKELVYNKERRQAMGAAARLEVEQLGWKSAIQRLRNAQYGRAMRNYRAHQRFWLLALRIRVARWWRLLMEGIKYAINYLVHGLDYARTHRGPESQFYSSTA